MSRKMELNRQVQRRLAGNTQSIDAGMRRLEVGMTPNRSETNTSRTASSEVSPMQQKVAQIRPDLEQHLTQAILMSKSPQEALFSLAKIIGETFHVEGCMIVPRAKNQTTAQPSCWFEQGSVTAQSPHELLGLLEQLLVRPDWELDEALAIADLQSMSGCMMPSSLPARAILVTETQFQGQVNGVVALVQSHPYLWKESDVQLFKSLSPQVAIAISQAHLEQQLQQQVRYQFLVDQLTTAIRNAWDLEDIFTLAVEGTTTALEISRGMLLLFKYVDPLHKNRKGKGVPKTKANVAAIWSRTDDVEAVEAQSVLAKNLTFWASDCRICQLVLTGKPDPVIVPVHDILTDANPQASDPYPGVASIFQLDSSDAMLLMPLENQGTVLGCLVLQHDQPRLWSMEELSFVKLVAAQLSTAIIQTRTLTQIQAVVQERTAQLQRSLEVQAKLYEKTRQQVEQLRRLNQEREEFLSTVSHELRTPLTSMTLAIRMLRQADLSPERRNKYLDILEQQCTQETSLINDLLALRKLESNPTSQQFQKVDIRYLIREAAQLTEENWAEKGLTLAMELSEDPIIVYTDPDSVSRILLELLTNAYKYAEPESTIELKLGREMQASRSQVALSLKNRGDGILPEELPHIFEKFRRGQGVTKRAIQGTGLGLALVKGLVEHLNGTIAASSEPQVDSDDWETCFKVTFPQYPEGMGLLVP
jgi:signal transduction histidine kinase